MKPSDPRLRAVLRPAARPLAGVLAAGVTSALLVIAQAFAVSALVIAAINDRSQLPLYAAVVAAVLALRGLVGWVGDGFSARAAAVVGLRLRADVVDAVIARRGRGEETPSSGAAATLATRGVTAAEPYLTRYVPAVILAGLLPPLVLVSIAVLDWWSALIVVLTLPLVPVFGALVGLATRDRAQRQWAAMASLSGHFLDVMRGLPTLVSYRRARVQSQRIAEMTDRYRTSSWETLRIAFASSGVLETVATLSVALVAVTVGVRLADGGLTLATALPVLLLAPEAYWPLRRMGAEFHAAAEGIATFEEVAELTADVPVASVRDDVGSRLVLDGVSHTYPGRNVPALTNVHATLDSPALTAIVGPSGCGKSTLLRLIADRLGAEAAWVPQRPGFLAGSVADNVRWAAPAATDEQVWAALRTVALEERVRDLDGGLDAVVGEDGATLSAGERARLALARVLVSDRAWVLLDEPTAHLDELTERIVADTLVELARTRGVIVVAHRTALVAAADAVIELPHPAVVAPRTDRAIALSVSRIGPNPDTDRSIARSVRDDPPPRASLWGATALGSLASVAGVALTATSGWLIVQASTHPPVLTMLVAIVGVRTFGLARPALRYVERLRSHDVALRLLARRRVEVYRTIVPLTPARLGRRRADALTSIVDDVDTVVDRELRVRMPVRSHVATTVISAAVCAWFSLAAGGLVLATAALAGGAAWWVARRGAQKIEPAALRARADLSVAVAEAATLAAEFLAWGPAPSRAAERGTAGAAARFAALTRRGARSLGAARAVVLLVCGLGVAANALTVAPAVSNGTLSAPMAALLILVPLALLDSALALADAGALSARTDAADRRLRAWEQVTPAVHEPDAPTSTGEVRAEIGLAAVEASWDGVRPALQGLDLHVKPGQRVGIVGTSGSGKSTVAALLVRFLDPTAGTLTFGGHQFTDLPLDDVRRQVGLVDDDPHVFASTVAENVRFARPDASDHDVETALRAARLGPWLDALPEGIDTFVGEGHAQVSGGERARLGVARSLLAQHPVLVLDEPTAHLDRATAEEVAAEVLASTEGRSVVWISHDRVGLERTDTVLDLDAVAATPHTASSTAEP